MKPFVKLCAASLLALAVLGTGMAEAEKPARKRKPTFFEQIFGGSAERRKTGRSIFGIHTGSKAAEKNTDFHGSGLAQLMICYEGHRFERPVPGAD
jgi:hypothetical protein